MRKWYEHKCLHTNCTFSFYSELRRRKRQMDEYTLAEEGRLTSVVSETTFNDNTSPELNKEEPIPHVKKEGPTPEIHVIIPPEMKSEGQPLNLHVQITYTCSCLLTRAEPSISSFNLCVPPEAFSTPSKLNVVLPQEYDACICVPLKTCTISRLPPADSSS